ncbi:sigma 54-interacting transcriptional regulator [Bacillus sp. SM2101]|uniref:sigma-54 interaction domain-containing protein n=1 Tax=Bacillus sp. SM2101 TaxID=2805366 RepID=UPI001BDEC350
MEKVIVMSLGRETNKYICRQVREITGHRIEVKGYCIGDTVDEDFSNCIVVNSVDLQIDNLRLIKIPQHVKHIYAKRVINHQFLKELIDIPAGTDVLLVNDHKDSSLHVIKQLKNYGIDHINYHPYYPGIKQYKQLTLAITPGETKWIPDCVNKVIDIGIRKLDITTIIEILQELNLLSESSEVLSSDYVSEIIKLSKKLTKISEESEQIKNMFQTIIDNTNDGIIYLNSKGEISVVNELMQSILGEEKDIILGKRIEEVLPSLHIWQVEEVDREIMKISEREVVVKKVPVKKNAYIVGYLITFEDVMEIKNIEYELRRRMRKTDHNATYIFEDIIGNSDMIVKNINLAKRLSLSSSTVLIQGESGTGKEFFAQSIHNFSKRKKGPFVAVNFAALPVNLLESELFGYEEGAFTGAVKGGKVGLFELAHGGSIFLDEIGDTPLELQSRLLRVLQEKDVRRVGGSKRIPIDVRVIAATNKDLKEEVAKGKFRQDLFYRINVLPLYSPSLRERREDIPLLLAHYLKRFSNGKNIPLDCFFDDETISYLVGYHWPGNVRELVNVIEYLVNIKNPSIRIQVTDLPGYVLSERFDDLCTENDRFIDEDMLWLLNKINERNGIGRRALTDLAKSEGIDLGESKIRRLLKKMYNLELIHSYTGMKGTVVTEKGVATLSSLKL